MSVRALAYIGIGVGDITSWETFATGILGMQLGSRGDDGTLFMRMDERHHRIAVHPGGNDDIAYLGWEVDDEAALQALGEKLRAAGIAYTLGDAQACRARNVGGLIACDDPAGIRSEFFWGALVQRPLPFNSPRGILGFHTGDEGMGHVVIGVPDAAAALRFYRDVLGMRVSDYIDFSVAGRPITATFMHCNPRHHSLAFAQTPGGKRLSHFMIQVNDLDDVGRTYSLCEREDVPIHQTLGRHVNDEMFSFYVTSPSGFTVEYGYGGRSVDDANWQIERYDATSIWGHRRLAIPVIPSVVEGQPQSRMQTPERTTR
jgi:2,3-dihydroxybiphenyl 1,2-dioxygenase